MRSPRLAPGACSTDPRGGDAVDDHDTIILRGSVLGDPGSGKKHAALVVLKGEEIGRDFRLRKNSMVIGRGESADILIADEGVSRVHARIEYRGRSMDDQTAFVITDLGSTNRTFVNARPIESVELRDGDKVQIGDTILKFVVFDDVEARFHAEVRDRITYDRLTGLLTKEGQVPMSV